MSPMTAPYSYDAIGALPTEGEMTFAELPGIECLVCGYPEVYPAVVLPSVKIPPHSGIAVRASTGQGGACVNREAFRVIANLLLENGNPAEKILPCSFVGPGSISVSQRPKDVVCCSSTLFYSQRIIDKLVLDQVQVAYAPVPLIHRGKPSATYYALEPYPVPFLRSRSMVQKFYSPCQGCGQLIKNKGVTFAQTVESYVFEKSLWPQNQAYVLDKELGITLFDESIVDSIGKDDFQGAVFEPLGRWR